MIAYQSWLGGTSGRVALPAMAVAYYIFIFIDGYLMSGASQHLGLLPTFSLREFCANYFIPIERAAGVAANRSVGGQGIE